MTHTKLAKRRWEEVVARLAALSGARVEGAKVIQARIPEGASDRVVRTVTDTC